MPKPKIARGSRLGARGKNRSARSPEPAAQSQTADLLFEIGTEELPAAYLPELIEQLKREAGALLAANHLPHAALQSFGTPRRLALLVQGLASAQRAPGAEVRGPSTQAAYDATGKPTQALTGFLRSQGGALNQTKVVSSEKGQYVYLVKPPTVIPTAKVLPALLSQLIGGLRAPKAMRWDASGVRFARPIRWLLALYGSRPIRVTFGALTSAPATWLGLPLRPTRVRVASPAAYRRNLQQAGIILDQATRRAWIERAVAATAKASKGRTAPEMAAHGLLDEVTFLVERPVALSGAFDSKYLTLPREVLLASMAKYQRVFALESGGLPAPRREAGQAGKVLPRFVAILDGQPGKPAAVRQLIERLLNARLADSLLFWTEDRKRPLHQADLTGVTLHEKLGSMADKTERLHKLAATLESAWRLAPEELAHLRRACRLAKADLVTTMVKEFPTLQGVMGKSYALDSGEPRAVAKALEEHYLPLGGKLPKTLIGSALAVLDKYDTLAGYFSIGIEPTGDQDPFGLRRAAQGIVEVAWAVHRPLPLERLFGAWQMAAPFAKGKTDVDRRLQRYLLERLYTFAWPAPAPGADLIEAVLASPCDDLLDVMERIVSLRKLDGSPGLRKAAKVIERTRNILRGAALRQDRVDPARLTEAPEQKLWELYQSHEDRVAKLAEDKAYADATTLFGEVFFEPLHQFFDQVLVNTPDEALQQNRLALMRAIQALYTDRIADLSKLTLRQHDEERA